MTQTDANGELERLLLSAERGELSESERDRLNELICADDNARSELIEQLETEALLRWHHGSVEPATSFPPLTTSRSNRLWRSLVIVGSIAACLVVMAGIAHLVSDSRSGPSRGGHPATDSPSGHLPNSPGSVKWRIQPTAQARYQLISPGYYRLEDGELYLESAELSQIRIATQSGMATSIEGRFRIESRDLTETGNPRASLTRVVVLAGEVTMTNSHGTGTAKAGERISTKTGEAPIVDVAP